MTDLMLSSNDEMTMSSREISALVNSRHVDVCRTIERLMGKATISEYAPTAYTHEQNDQQYHEYKVGKRDSYVIVAQLSPEFTARLVDRWQELESQQAPKIPQTMHEALRLAADALEKNAHLSLVARQQGDRIKSLQNLFEAGVTPFEFAKRLNGVNCQEVYATLKGRGWLYRDASSGWRVSSTARDLYLTERSGRRERTSGQVMITATPVLLKRGAALLHKLYLHEQLPMKKTWDGTFTHPKTGSDVQ
ncbi:MAG: Rha family transcriptional regulator [Marinobacter sp.]